MQVTGDEVRDAMTAAGIESVPHHACSICGEWTEYQRLGDRLFYQSACGCSWSPAQERDWSSAADWINMQSSPEHQRRLREQFGLPAEPA